MLCCPTVGAGAKTVAQDVFFNYSFTRITGLGRGFVGRKAGTGKCNNVQSSVMMVKEDGREYQLKLDLSETRNNKK